MSVKCKNDDFELYYYSKMVGYHFFSMNKNGHITDNGFSTWPMLNVFLSTGGFGTQSGNMRS